MVAHTCHGVGVAGDFPAAEMLGADGEAERFGGVEGALFEVASAFLRVVELVGDGGAVYGGEVRVEGVGGVDCGEGFFEGGGHFGRG